MSPFSSPSGLRYLDGTPVPDGPGYHPHLSTRFANRELAQHPDRLPELYSQRSECCGCTGCVFACSVGAITMMDDEEGFEYPTVDAAKCVGCGACIAACVFKERLLRE